MKAMLELWNKSKYNRFGFAFVYRPSSCIESDESSLYLVYSKSYKRQPRLQVKEMSESIDKYNRSSDKQVMNKENRGKRHKGWMD